MLHELEEGQHQKGHKPHFRTQYNLILFWALTLTLLAIFAVIDYAVIEQQRVLLRQDTEMITLNSRQRTLLQRIGLLARLLVSTSNPDEQIQIRGTLRDSTQELITTHRRLLDTFSQRNPLRKASQQLRRIYFEPPADLHKYILQFLKATSAFIETPNGMISPEDPNLKRLTVISSSKFINAQMQKAEEIQSRAVKSHILFLKRIDHSIMAAQLVLMGLLTVFAFIPMMRQLVRQVRELREANQQLSHKTHQLEDSRRAALNILEDADLARVRAEEAKEAVYRLAAIVATTSDAIFAKTLDEIVTEWNESAERLYGYTAKEIIGKSVRILSLPDRQGEMDAIMARIRRGESAHHLETKRMRKDRTIIDVELSIAPIRDEHQNIIGASSIARDISLRKRLEAQILQSKELFERFMNNSPTIAFMKDDEGRYTYINRPFEQAFSIRFEQVEGKKDYDWLPQEDANLVWQHDQEVLKSGQTHEYEEMVPTPDGKKQYWLVYKFPILNAVGDTNLGGVAVNITDRIKIQEQLREFAARLQFSNQELQNFANIVAHDLNEPVHKIITFGDLITQNPNNHLDAESQDYLKRMRAATVRMGELIDDLLEYSRVTSKVRNSVAVNLNDILRDVLSDIELKIQDSGSEVKIGMLPAVEGDPVQLRQLFQNLILNSIKFRHKEERPSIEIEGHPNGAATVEVTLRDNGIGFDQKYAERIFVPFQRLHGRGEYEGTGMGLAICKKIVENHGGEIWAQGEVGKGAAFFIRLKSTTEVH